MPFVETDGVAVYYRTDGEGPAIVFVHGRASNHLSWMHQVPDLATDHTVVTFDLRGFGRTMVRDDQDHSMWTQPQDLATLIDHLELDSVALVGHAMGGFAVMDYAYRHPDRTRCLVLASTPAGINDPAVIEGVAETRRDYAKLDYPARNYRPSFIERRPEIIYQWQAQKEAGPTYPKEFLEPVFDGGGPSAADLAGFEVPTLIFAGEYDCVLSVEVAERMASIIPNSSVVVAEDCGHCAYNERPLLYNRTIREFSQANKG